MAPIHVVNYKIYMDLRMMSKGLKCRAFLAILDEQKKMQFASLAPSSITSFKKWRSGPPNRIASSSNQSFARLHQLQPQTDIEIGPPVVVLIKALLTDAIGPQSIDETTPLIIVQITTLAARIEALTRGDVAKEKRVYIRDELLPKNKAKVLSLVHESAYYLLEGNDLYRRSLTHSYQKCLAPTEAKAIMTEIHEVEDYGHHLGWKNLV
ncbi:hypothetical protein ACLOJK_040165 [Asimina triloba]